MGIETWANLSVLEKYIEPKQHQTRDEWLRQERVAVGRICRCNNCLCCAELKAQVGGNHEPV